MRTYKQTYKSFLDNIIYPNIKDGYMVDIFIHTWDVFNVTDSNAWHAKQNLFPTLSNKPLTKEDMNEVINIYNPKKIVFEKDNGKQAQRYHKIRAVNQLRLEYEKENNIKYDFFLTTRPDIYFLKPFRLNEYLNFYATHPSFQDKQLPDNPLNIFIKYRQNMEYLLCRENTKLDEYDEMIKHSFIQNLKDENQTYKTIISEKSKSVELLQNEINFHKENINKLQKKLSNANKYTNYLSYKLGKELIIAGHNWYKGGFILFIFKALSIIKEHKNKVL
ncbi:hypothetical protein [Campylobacter vicugnae]|uniref:hypothetical protein n=1 Tax=Campylobacter vicugnae TaxID=1660076 RepID=UPI00112FB7C4|nr:hypothetical protein [Campylobacter sp. RM9262]